MRRPHIIAAVVIAALIVAASIFTFSRIFTSGSSDRQVADRPATAAPETAQPSTPMPVAAEPAHAGEPSAAERSIDAAHPFIFRRLVLDTSGDAPEACFRFSRPLDARAEAHYGDYVTVEPAVSGAARVANTDLCLTGFTYGTTYKVTLAAGLPALSGERTDRPDAVEVTLGDRPARVAISGAGYILSRDSGNGLAVQTVNVERVAVHVLRMSERLLTTRIHSSGSYFDNAILGGQTATSRYELKNILQNQATVVWSGDMTIPPDHNRSVETAFPLSKIIKPGDIGAYLVVAEDRAKALSAKFWTSAAAGAADEDDDYDRWTRSIAAHWAVVTDTALTAMTGADGLYVSARSLATAEPVAGIKLALLAEGQDLLGEALTDAAGMAHFAPGLLRGKGAAAAALITAYGAAGDFAMLDLRRAAFDLSDRGVSGRPPSGPADAFLYTERGIYRPGETVNVMALLRDTHGDALPRVPLALVLRRPDGVEAKRFSLPAAPQSGFHQAIALSKSAAFGLWSVEALADPASPPIGRVQFAVQDFVPQMLKVTLTPATPVLRPEAPIEARLEGWFLYGAPAAGLKGEAELRILRDANPVPEAKGYSFGLIDEKVSEDAQPLDLAEADDTGHSAIKDTLKSLPHLTVPLKGVLSAGLFEPSGRIVKDEVELPIRMQPLLIGLKPRFADDRAEEGKEATVDVRVFDEAGHAIARPGLHWTLVRENRVYDWFEMGGGWRWHFHTVDESVASGSIDVTENVPAALSQSLDWGDYRLVVDDPATGAATSIRFSAGWRETTESADTPDKVEVTVERAAYAPGETARLHIASPFAGKAQLTIAGDRIFETRAIDIPKEGTVIPIETAAQWGSGAYAILSLYRPLTKGRPHDPVRAVGLAWIGIDTQPKTLTVDIVAPEKVLPRQSVEVSLKLEGAKAGEASWVTLAAVDEGILQLTRFSTPNATAYLFAKRRLGIDIRDDYGRLLDASADPGAIREGGDSAAAPLGGQGLEVRSTRAVSLFSGPVQFDAERGARITLDIPDFEGQLRLMAVAYGDHAVGGGEGHLIVRDPVIADLSLPRFLAPGDHARLALLLHNTDGAAGAYHLALASDGAARVEADHPLDYTLGTGEKQLDAVAIDGLDDGVGTIRADLSGPGGYKVHREWQIAVRAPHYPIAIEDTRRQAPGERVVLDARQLGAFVPGSVSVSVGYSAFAGLDVASLLQSLYRYPYGCTEQLVSTTYPLLYFGDPVLLGAAPKDEGVKARITRTIDTLLDRQDAAGKMGLWRANDGMASVWLNVYALDFLLHARDAGFEVPDAALSRSFSWLNQVLQRLDQENAGNFFEGPQATRAYAFYVMARYGRANAGQLRYAHDTIDATRLPGGGFSPASVYWRPGRQEDSLAQAMSLGQLGGALSLLGDHTRAHDAFEMAIANLGIRSFPGWWFSYSYYTEVQDAAGLLAVAAESGETDITEEARQRLVSLAPSSEDMNTQAKAWVLAAIHALNHDDRALSLEVNGKAVDQLKLPTAFAPTVDELRQGFAVGNTSERDLWRTVVTRGSPKVAPSAVDAGYTIQKHYFHLDGTPLDPARLRQNDRFIVSISGENKDHEMHQTVLADLLPAGWEIEAPLVSGRRGTNAEQQAYDFLGPLSRPLVVEARDDRFVAAFDLGRDRSRWQNPYFVDDEGPHLDDNAFHLAYIVRVVTPGTFTLPEAVVEDMYRPGVMARTDAGDTAADPR
jgi:alpha-2-macroglobulin